MNKEVERRMFERYGVTPMAEKAYSLLPETDSFDADDVAAALDDDGDVTLIMKELADFGLVEEVDERRWTAMTLPVASAKLVERELSETRRAAEQAQTLNSLPDASDVDDLGAVGGNIRVFEGSEAIGETLRRIISTSSLMRGFDRPPYAVPRTGPFTVEYMREHAPEFTLLERGGTIRTVYQPGFLDNPDRTNELTFFMTHGERARFGETPEKMMIFDDRIVMISPMRRLTEILDARAAGVPEPPAQMIMLHGSEILVHQYVDKFEEVWRRASDFVFDGQLGLDYRNSRLAEMLLEGKSVDQIRHSFGRSRSAVNRWISGLMKATRSKTPHQLGADLQRLAQDGLLNSLPDFEDDDGPGLVEPE